MIRYMNGAVSNVAQNPLASVQPWDWVAESYDEISMPFLALFAEPAVERAQLSSFMRVVDVAAGTGSLTCRVAPRVSWVDAIDFSAKMVKICERRSRELGIANVAVVQGDGQALPYADATFDVGFSMFGLMFFPDRDRGFRELLRVLKSGGNAYVTSWAPLDQSPFMLARVDVQRVVNPDSVPPQQNLLTLENPDRFEKEMRDAGFAEVSVEPVHREFEFRSFQQFFAGITRGSAPFELLKRKVGATEWARHLDVMRSYMEPKYQTFPLRLGSTALLGCGRKPA